MKKQKSTLKIFLYLSFFIILLLGFDKRLKVTHYSYTNAKIPLSFDNYNILQISDFHCASFGQNEKLLINRIKELSPDLIVFTGDMIDKKHTTISNISILLNEISTIAPIYAVNGNHEKDNSVLYKQLQSLYQKYNVTELNDRTISLSQNNETIYLHGLNWYSSSYFFNLPKLNNNHLNILLSHGSNYFDVLSSYNYDLILSGHVHGGIIRLPFLGGLIANDNTLFPKYDKGLFYENSTTMISSSGLGNAAIPRFFNRPELVLITLHTTSG